MLTTPTSGAGPINVTYENEYVLAIEAILDNSVVIVSADVSYAAPGLNSPSMAAITVSISANATRYATAIKTNSYRVEMITDKNIEKYIISLIENG
ncbi:unnamed protein product [Aureobasidium pullulans]|nr:unnamed protein product [Aureobasidium pullulans]